MRGHTLRALVLRYLLLVAAVTGWLWADGDVQALLERKCGQCHQGYVPQQTLTRNYEANNTLLHLKAPTLTELSFWLKNRIGDRKGDAESQTFEIEAWLGEFLQNPSKHAAIMPPSLKRFFGDMPPVTLSEEELEAVAAALYAYAETMMIRHGVKRYDYKEAYAKAKKEGKLVLIEGYLPYCRWCQRMDREVMTHERVKAYLDKHFVFVKKNVATETLPLGIRRLGTPSFYFIDPAHDRVVDAVEGYGNVEEFLALLQSVVKKATKQ